MGKNSRHRVRWTKERPTVAGCYYVRHISNPYILAIARINPAWSTVPRAFAMELDGGDFAIDDPKQWWWWPVRISPPKVPHG